MSKDREVLFSYGRYVMRAVDDCHYENRVMKGYELYNTKTDVREFEHPVYYRVLNMALVFEDSIEMLLKDGLPGEATENEELDLDAFEIPSKPN